MKIRKIIDKRIHEIEFLKIAQLEKKLINNISNLDILIFDMSNIFGFLAIILAAVNIFGGFLVTQRMLAMYKKKKKDKK